MRPSEGVEAQLPGILDQADMVKFARASVSREEARRTGTLAKEIVDHVEARINPESEPAKRLNATKEKAA
jgi:hypothetical protein